MKYIKYLIFLILFIIFSCSKKVYKDVHSYSSEPDSITYNPEKEKVLIYNIPLIKRKPPEEYWLPKFPEDKYSYRIQYYSELDKKLKRENYTLSFYSDTIEINKFKYKWLNDSTININLYAENNKLHNTITLFSGQSGSGGIRNEFH